MKRLFILLIFLLSACVSEPISIPTVKVAPSATRPAPIATAIPASPTLSPTETPIPCDPLVVDFCITDGHFVFQRPILPPNNDSVEETYRFASTASGTRESHHGVEFINGTGTPVHAAADGQIIFAGSDDEAVYSPWPNFYGNIIVIRHADSLFTLYAHLSLIDVQAGEEVQVGQKIGEVGLTGSANGSHLHFEVRRGDVEDYFSTLNPELWLIPKAGEGALAISVMNTRGKFQNVDFTLQFTDETYFVKTYEDASLTKNENAALGLKAGRYRIAFLFGGKIYERWVEVESGRLTQVVFVMQ
ncbi:MAG: M23 family metallopeptidase [Anaerolineaceae bacterium]|nr:MAG: M23 family metallopeptidase [Anaerolineaceae bacterium]